MGKYVSVTLIYTAIVLKYRAKVYQLRKGSYVKCSLFNPLGPGVLYIGRLAKILISIMEGILKTFFY